LWGRNLFEKRFSSPPCPAIASATAEPLFPKTFTGIAFITSNKSNSNLFYIKEIQRFTCNNFYCCCINSRLLIFFVSKQKFVQKNRGFATFCEVLQQPPRKFKKNCLFSIIYQYREQSGYKKQTAVWKQDVSIPLIICRKTAPAGRPYFPLSGGRKSCCERF